jgi:hypothetical protein
MFSEWERAFQRSVQIRRVFLFLEALAFPIECCGVDSKDLRDLLECLVTGNQPADVLGLNLLEGELAA